MLLLLSLWAAAARCQTATGVSVPADWREKGYAIELNDPLAHPGLSWPLTLLEYELDFGLYGPAEDSLTVVDAATGREHAFQLANKVAHNGLLRKATLYFLSDLPSGSSRAFRLIARPGPHLKPARELSVQREGETVVVSNGMVKLRIPAPGSVRSQAPIISYGNADAWLGQGRLPAAFTHAAMEVRQLQAGPLLAEYEIAYTFAADRRYKTNIRLSAAMEFATLDEEITGFAATDSLAWQMVWDQFHPTVRYAPTRAGIAIDGQKDDNYGHWRREPMVGYSSQQFADKHPLLARDQQNGPDGKLPFHLAVYDNWVSWWRLPTAAFWNEQEAGVTIGLFVRNAEKWDDGQYPIGGSKSAPAICYYWQHNVLDYSFPLVNGSRSTALAIYDHAKDIALINGTNKPLAYIDYLRRYYGWVSLDKTKNWVLDYRQSDGLSPKYFNAAKAGGKLDLLWLEQSLHNMLTAVATGSERNGGPTPVGARVFCESIAPAFDINKSAMNPDTYRRLRARFLFMSYVFMDEAFMPVRTMLSGHPNFLADIKSVPGLAAFLFPGHPQAKEMAAHFETAVRLNYQYHIRPDVSAWEAKGGRWTENLSTYTWAALRSTLRTGILLQHAYDGRNRSLQPGVSALAGWLLGALTSPLDNTAGRRTYPPQGAHATDFKDGLPLELRLLGQQLVDYDPLLAEHIFWVTSKNDKAFEGERERAAVWEDLLTGELGGNKGTPFHLGSEKYTGYGFVLRSSAAGKEMYVHLQQIDDGPNYRWGRAAGGGNGIIHYYAEGKRYSFNGPEDVGDGPFGDVERCTNFGVRKQPGYRDIGPYRSVGRNDLTAPLYDAGFAREATVYARKYVSDAYRSRSVLQSGADYIAIFDDVADDTIRGRFSWFVGKEDAYPFIYQLSPGASPVDAAIAPSKSSYHTDSQVLPVKGRYYDGAGDFLTIVTHRAGLKTSKTNYGCDVLFENGDNDKVFRSGSPVRYQNDGIAFSGTCGLIKIAANGKEMAAALFAGSEIMAADLKVLLQNEQATAISFQAAANGYTGKYQSRTSQIVSFHPAKEASPALQFYIDGTAIETVRKQDGRVDVTFPAGAHSWQWTNTGVVPGMPQILGTVNRSGGCKVAWTSVAGATAYRLELSRDNGTSWQTITDDVSSTSAVISAVDNGTKIHLRVTARGVGGWGSASGLYPVYVTDKAPRCPQGLTLHLSDTATIISWGKVLGAAQYHLYRREKGSNDTAFELVYSGENRRLSIAHTGATRVYEYAVTAVNDNGESGKSAVCDTDPTCFLNQYSRWFDGFRRDTENHENGFPEFDPAVEDKMPILNYPD
jgi:hypothetical protein